MQPLDNRGYFAQEIFQLLCDQVRQNPEKADKLVQAAGDLLRYNTLLSVARAGSGDLGTALSLADLLAELFFRQGTFNPAHADHKDRDIFVLSIGHAAPVYYSILAAQNFFPTAHLDRLHRWKGLPGHPQVTIPGVDATTGSPAMGLSQAAGLAIAKQRFGLGGTVYVLCGNDEMQEGQSWEALFSVARFACPNFYLLLDANKVQTDDDLVPFRNHRSILEVLGFAVVDCDGHDAPDMHNAFKKLATFSKKPKCLYAQTKKGRGVSYLEQREAGKQPGDHCKAPGAGQLAQAHQEILDRVKDLWPGLGLAKPSVAVEPRIPLEAAAVGIQGKPLLPAFAEGVLEIARHYPEFLVLDAALEQEYGLAQFRKEFPERVIKLGMAQHMCTAAAALAALGFVPIINSYAANITSRSNEQIFHLATDPKIRFILVGHLAGVIPATLGMSYQAFRDIGSLRSIPGLAIYQPMGPEDCQGILHRFARGEVGARLYVRLALAASAPALPPGNPHVPMGHSQIVRQGSDAIILTAGPVMVGEAIAAADNLAAEGIQVEVRSHPWVTVFAPQMVKDLVGRHIPIIVAEDHHRLGGLGEGFFAAVGLCGLGLARSDHVALDDLPGSGFRTEALAGMGLGREAIAQRLRRLLQGRAKLRAA